MTAVEHGSMQQLRREQLGTLQDLAAEVQRQQDAKRDYVVDTRRMSFVTEPSPQLDEQTGIISDGPMWSRLTFDARENGHGVASIHHGVDGGPLTEFAHGQMAGEVGIPKRYYDRMRSDAPDLLDRNVQHWLLHEPKKRMVRILDDQVRALLSNRYRRLDNGDLLEQAVLPVLGEFGEDRLRFHTAALTETRLYLRVILPELAADVEQGWQPGRHELVERGDIVQAGVEIRNSEVGQGKLSVAPFIWRLRCLNGLLIRDATLARYHVGRELEESLEAILSDEARQADDRAFFLQVRDAVKAALTETAFSAIVEQMHAAFTGEPVRDPVAATERLAKSYDLGEGEQRSVLAHLAAGGDLSQWGVVNAVTRAARDAETWERQADLEELGGVLVALPEREWAALAR